MRSQDILRNLYSNFIVTRKSLNLILRCLYFVLLEYSIIVPNILFDNYTFTESSPDPTDSAIAQSFNPAIQEANNLSSEAIAAVERSLASSSGVSPASSSGAGATGGANGSGGAGTASTVGPNGGTATGPPPQRINGTLPGYNHVRNNEIVSPEHGKCECYKALKISLIFSFWSYRRSAQPSQQY